MVTTDEVVELALVMGCELGSQYGDPALRFESRHVVTLDRLPGAFSIRLDWEDHDWWMTEHPELVYKTAHFETWPYLLVRQEGVSREQVEEMLVQSIRVAKKSIKRRLI